MDPYTQPSLETIHALDFTSSMKREPEQETVEPPVLDLSCKKSAPSNGRLGTSRSDSPLTQKQSANSSESERKSPFEGRTFMVTPPSESDSPKKTKFEPIYNCAATSSVSTGVPTHFSPIPMNVPLPVVPTVLPHLLGQNGTGMQQIQMISGTVSSASSTSSSYAKEMGLSNLSSEAGKKAPRPFKAYPKDPLSLTIGTAELMYDQNSTEAYSEFRKRMLESVRKSNEGTNIKMRRVTKSPGLPTSTVDEKDAAYWERRRKNNEAAKRSRDARRAKEDEIAIRAAFLEQENMKLKYELVALRNETAKLRCMVYSN